MSCHAKLTAEKILEAALGLLETGGPDALGVRPSSLHRHYPERDALLKALEAPAAHNLHAAIRDAAQGQSKGQTPAALTAAAHAYLRYAHAHPHLYSLLLRPKAPYTAEPAPGKDLWNEVLALVGGVTGNPDDTAATVAFWAARLYAFRAERAVRLERPQRWFRARAGATRGFRRCVEVTRLRVTAMDSYDLHYNAVKPACATTAT